MRKLTQPFRYLIVFSLGVITSYYVIDPYLHGYYNDEIAYMCAFIKGENYSESIDSEKFQVIEERVNRFIFKEFHQEFGEDAFIKYGEYLSQCSHGDDDVIMFQYSKHELDNHSNQLNPNNDAYWESRGYDERPDDWEVEAYGGNSQYSKDELDNHSNQLNPNNDAYWESRGYDERPDDWESRKDK